MAPFLLGPPEIHNNNNSQQDAAPSSNSSFIDLIVSKFNDVTTTNPNPPMTLTENSSATFLSSGNPCLDFFFHVVPDTPSQSLIQRLQLAWAHNPLTTLKLVCNLRGVRSTGKSDKEGFYAAALWLYSHHPKTLASNVPSLSHFGYFKDLPEILFRILEGLEVRKTRKEEWEKIKGSNERNKLSGRRGVRIGQRVKNNNMNKPNVNVNVNVLSGETRVREEMARAKAEKERARAAREDKKVAMAKKLVNRYQTHPDFRLLHDSVSDHFAQCLKKDLQFLNSGVNHIGSGCERETEEG